MIKSVNKVFFVVKIETYKANVNFFHFSNKDYNAKQLIFLWDLYKTSFLTL
jgi:hypothetical protein